MKYIVVEDRSGNEIMVTFSPIVPHKEMAARFNCVGEKVISAGFVRCFETEHISCSGCSVSLNKVSRAEDTNLIRASINAT